MIPPPGWNHAQSPDGTTWIYRRFTGHDRLDVLGWQQAQMEELAQGIDPVAIAKAELDREAQAMALRLCDDRGSPIHVMWILELAGTDPELYQWLSRLLYGPAWDELENGGSQSKKNYSKLSRYHRGILRLLRGIAGLALPTSTTDGNRDWGTAARSRETALLESLSGSPGGGS